MTDLPNGWAWTTLGEVAPEVKTSNVQPTAGTTYELWSVPAFTSGRPEVLDGRTILSSKRPVQPGDVLVCKINPRINRVWRVDEYRGNQQIASPEWIAVRPNETGCAVPQYLQYYLSSPKFRGWIAGRVSGVTGSHTRAQPREVMAQPIPLPPLAEQYRIVEMLEDHLSRLDAGDVSLQVCGKKAAALRSRAVEAAVETCFDREQAAAGERLARILELRETLVRQRRKDATPPAYQLDLPAGWVTASVDQLCWQIQYGTSTRASEVDSGTDVAVLRMGNIQNGDIHVDSLKYIPADDPSLNDLLLESGDLLFNRTNSAELVGKTAVFTDQLRRATFASYLIRCRTVPGVNAQWISYIVNSSIGRRYIESVMSQQVGQANVNGTKLAAMPIPITCADAESVLLEEISELRRSGARLAGEVSDGMDRSRALRRSLLRAAFSGALVDQDPSDEPAAVALERLRVESTPVRKRAMKRSVATATRS